MAQHAVACLVTRNDFNAILLAHPDAYVTRYNPPAQHIGLVSDIVFLKDGSAFIKILDTNSYYGYTCPSPDQFIDVKYIDSIRPKPHQHVKF
jgi:hypothetical protein